MSESSAPDVPPAPPSKTKGVFGLLRRGTSSQTTPTAAAPIVDQKPLPTTDVTEEDVIPAADDDPLSTSDETEPVLAPTTTGTTTGLSGTEIEARWDQAILEAKNKKTVMQKLRRLTSKDSGGSKGKAKEDPTVAPIAEVEQTTAPPVASASTAPSKLPSNYIPGSNTLSKRIQVMLSNVPPFLHTVPEDTPATTPNNTTPSTTAVPAPAPGPSAITDAKLLSYLSDADVMNNAKPTAGKSTRKSVWEVLDQLVPYKAPVVTTTDTEESTEEEAAETSLMVCAPLVPDQDSKVELAQSQVIQVESIDDYPGVPKNVAKGVFLSLFPDNFKLPFFGGKKKPTAADQAPPATPPPKPTKTVKVWIPSPTKVSFQVAWWGYRVWLPEPVMSILSNDALEAAARATMVTNAIAWIINNIPSAMLPLPLLAAVTLLKAVVPFLGYIGGFISWSWGEVKSFDKGQGVVLSATWLLPIALIPGTWEVVTSSIPVGSGTTVTEPAAPPPPSNSTPAPPVQ